MCGSLEKEDPTYRKLVFYDALENQLLGMTDIPLALIDHNMTFYFDQIYFFGGRFSESPKDVSTYSFFFDLHT